MIGDVVVGVMHWLMMGLVYSVVNVIDVVGQVMHWRPVARSADEEGGVVK